MSAVNVFVIILLQTNMKLTELLETYSGCDHNRVGSHCSLECHCFASRCAHDRCRYNEKCEHGYFGYYCQYEDFFVEASERHIFASDDDDKTCFDGGNNVLQATFTSTLSFHFVSLVVKNFETLTETHKRNNIILKFKHNGDLYVCNNQELWEVSRTEVEIRCLNETIFFTELILVGPSVAHVCEIRLSGGRSVGRFPGDVRFPPSDKITTGLINSMNGVPNDAECFESENIAGNGRWEIHVMKPFNVYHLRLHNLAGDSPKRMLGFTVRLSDAMNNIFYKHVVAAEYQTMYEIATNSTSYVTYITIDDPQGNDFISLCEAEILGDCPVGLAGLDCQVNCAEQCFEGRGRCSLAGDCYLCTRENGLSVCRKKCSGCDDTVKCKREHGMCEGSCLKGFKGEQCLDLCLNCADTGECHKTNGLCISKCVDGYMGVNCTEACGKCYDKKCEQHSGNCSSCEIGYYGSRCTKKCHQCKEGYCEPDGKCSKGCHDGYRGNLCLLECNNCDGTGACNQTTGACTHGCLAGFRGLDCTESCGHCREKKCERVNGTCPLGCINGYSGVTCKEECLFCKNRDCDSVTGRCRKGCINGAYGDNCTFQCQHCKGHGACNRSSGVCVDGCAPGYFEATCTEECGNCAPSKICKINGECPRDCLPGFTGSQCRDNKDDLQENKKFTVFVFYSIFLAMVGFTFFVLFFSQKIYWFCSADSRESFENKIRWLSGENKDNSIVTKESSFTSSAKSSSGATFVSGSSSSVDDEPVVYRPPTPPLSVAANPPAVPPAPAENIVTLAM